MRWAVFFAVIALGACGVDGEPQPKSEIGVSGTAEIGVSGTF